MGSWLELDEHLLNLPVHERIRGADVEVMVPPQDVPQAVRSYFDAPNQRYVIEFKYLTGNEKLVEGAANDLVKCLIGRESGRLFEIAVSGADPDHIASRLADGLGPAMEQLNARHQVPRRAGNYRATTGVIKLKRKELIDDLVSH